MISNLVRLWSLRTAAVPLQAVTKRSIGSKIGRFGVDMAEYSAYAYVVENATDLWEEEIGEVSDDFELIMGIILPILMMKGRGELLNAKGSETISKLLKTAPKDLLAKLRNLPVITGLKEFILKQRGVKNFGFVRDTASKSATFTNSKGMSIMSISDKGLVIDGRIHAGLKKNGNSELAKNIGIVGGTALGLDYLFGSDVVPKEVLEYLSIYAQSIEDAAGFASKDDRMTGEIKFGGQWYKDIGSLHKEILTNTRYVIADLMNYEDVTDDVADDLISAVLTFGHEMFVDRSIKAIDLTGPALEKARVDAILRNSHVTFNEAYSDFKKYVESEDGVWTALMESYDESNFFDIIEEIVFGVVKDDENDALSNDSHHNISNSSGNAPDNHNGEDIMGLRR